MRARSFLWIAGGVLAFAIVALLIRPEPGLVSGQVLGEGNMYRTVFMTNSTARSFIVVTRSESKASGEWVAPSSVRQVTGWLKPGEVYTSEVLLPTNGPKRVVVLLVPQQRRSMIADWVSTAKFHLGMEPQEFEIMSVEIEVE